MKKIYLLIFLIASMLKSNFVFSDDRNLPQIRGYVKYLPSARFSPNLDKINFDQLLHNRINIDWDFNSNFKFHGAVRTRVFQGYNVENIPFYEDFITIENGFINASQLIFKENSWMMHTMSDRFFLEYSYEKWQIRLGRQRINWGVNMVSNPNDLFNTYSFFDFDYEERPGTDAIRIQHFISPLSRFEIAYSPGMSSRESVAAAMYAFNKKNYDIQLITGYFHHRIALGGAWAGSIKNTGFKGEITFFNDLEKPNSSNAFNFTASVSADHRFQNGGFFVAEYLYSQQRFGQNANLLLLTQPFRADKLSFTDHSVFMNYTHPVSPILSLGMASFYYPSENGAFFSPNINYNLAQNFDLMVLSQIFVGGKNSMLSQAGYLFASALKWNF